MEPINQTELNSAIFTALLVDLAAHQPAVLSRMRDMFAFQIGYLDDPRSVAIAELASESLHALIQDWPQKG